MLDPTHFLDGNDENQGMRVYTRTPSDSIPEGVVIDDNARDVEILFDQGDHTIGGNACKDVGTSSQFFSDTIIHVP